MARIDQELESSDESSAITPREDANNGFDSVEEGSPDVNSNTDATTAGEQPESASNNDTTGTGTVTAARPLDNLHNRLLSQQRSNILLQVLFHHMINSRRRRQEEEEELAVNPPPLPDRPMPVLSHEEALSTNAICRFCFESSLEEERVEGTPPNSLVAPCNCSGGSRWVHLECLQQWQRLQARNSSLDDSNSSTSYTTAGYICNVCNSPYLSRPPSVRKVRRNVLKRGTLLISKQNVGRTFRNTVILLLNDIYGGAFGLIINSPLAERSIPARFSQQDNNNNNGEEQHDNAGNNIEWRRGGPVCGGRLGVVHYTLLHTYPPNWFLGQDDVLDVDIDEEYFEEDQGETNSMNDDDTPRLDDLEIHENDTATTDDEMANTTISSPNSELGDDDDDDDPITPADAENDMCAPLSLPVFDLARNNPPIQFVASPETQDPATFSEESLSRMMPRLLDSHPPSSAPSSSSSSSTSSVPLTEMNNDRYGAHHEEGDPSNEEESNSKMIVFMGYCKWRAGQLQREIQRELWDVCVDATPADILRHHSTGLWEEMSESDRLLSWQQLTEDDGNDSTGI